MLELIGLAILLLLLSPFIVATFLGIGIVVLGTFGVVAAVVTRIIRG